MGSPSLAVWLSAVFLISVTADVAEYRLHEDLMKNYSPYVRPVTDFNEALVVKLKVLLQQIVGLDEKNQVIETNVWLQYAWEDKKLKWEPSEYNNVTDIRFPVGKIWQPDILLYNSADPNFDSTYPSNLIVYSGGYVSWIPPGILKSSCKVDITWFPFDEQNCFLKFGSWTYNGLALDLQIELDDRELTDAMDISEYLQNGEWILMKTPAFRLVKTFSCCPEPYPYLKFYMRIRRRTLYYGFNLIIPSLLISLMTVLGFTLPPDAGEKITLEITILLSVCFFLSIVSDMTPPTSEAVPLIGTFFSCCMLVVSASVVFTVVVLNLHFRTPDTHEMTPFVRAVLLNWLPWLLMMRRPGRKFQLSGVFDEEGEVEAKNGCQSDQLMRRLDVVNQSPNHMMHPNNIDRSLAGQQNNHWPVYSAGHLLPNCKTEHTNNNSPSQEEVERRIRNCLQPFFEKGEHNDVAMNAFLLMMQRLLSELKFITARMAQEDADGDQENDWKFAAMVVDRLCLVVFSAFIVASTCGIMFSAPHLVS